jgi:glucokinase
VFAAAAIGEPAALKILQRALEATEVATWTLLHTLMPERIILGGGIMEEHFELFAGPMRVCIGRATQVPRGRVEVAQAKLGNDAGLVGAASLVLPFNGGS